MMRPDGDEVIESGNKKITRRKVMRVKEARDNGKAPKEPKANKAQEELIIELAW